MQVIDPAKDSGTTFALVYGASGTGKTHLMGTLGDMGKVLIIDVDQGYKTLTSKSVPGITDKMRNNLTIVSFDQFKDLNEAFHLVEKNDPVEWNKTFNRGKKPEERVDYVTEKFDWIVWDTWSELQWAMMQELRKNEGLISSNMGKDLDFRKNIQIQHWGALTDLNKLSVEALRECTKKHIANQVFVMQEKVDKNETLNTVEKGPMIHGKLMSEMPAYFDEVVRTYTNPAGGFMATTKRKAGWPAKTRTGEGKEYDNPVARDLFSMK